MFNRLLNKLFIGIGLLVLSANIAQSQSAINPGISVNSCTANTGTATACTAWALPQGFSPTISWTTTYVGGPSAVSVSLQGSQDNSSWFTLDTTTNTAGELRYLNPIALKFIRAYITTRTGGTNTTVTFLVNRGFSNVASGGTFTTGISVPVSCADGLFGYTFNGDTNTKLCSDAAGVVKIKTNGSANHVFRTDTYYLLSDSASLRLGAAEDANLFRDAANAWGIRNGTANQTLNIYETSSASNVNYGRFRISYSSGLSGYELGTQAGGTGDASRVVRLSAGGALYLNYNIAGGGSGLNFQANGTSVWEMTALGNFLAVTDDTYNIGATVANRPQNIYSSKTLTPQYGAGIAILGGADNTGSTLTDATNKVFRVASPHYTLAEEPFGTIIAISNSSANNLNFGGGSSLVNAATSVNFFTALDTTSTTGTNRWQIDTNGRFKNTDFPPTFTTDLKLFDTAVTWNEGSTTFSGWKLNVTDTASAATSLLMDLQVGGASKFNVDKAGIPSVNGTPGVSATCAAGVASMTVTNGIITAITCS